MSDVITKLRKLGLDNDNQQNQQGQTQAIAQASVANTPQPLMAPSTQQTALKLGSLIPAGNPKLRAMVEEVKGFSIIEKAILAMVVFENDEVVNKIKPEDWVNLIKDKIGEEYAEVFRAWLESRGIKVGVQQ
jgi:hypothetical protein